VTALLNDRARLKLAVSQAKLEEVGLTPLQRAKQRNDEIVRQYVENGIRTEQIADLMGMPNWRVREVLRSRGLPVGMRQSHVVRIEKGRHGRRLILVEWDGEA